jgi:thiol-disulfide isomerase/thioredoxin
VDGKTHNLTDYRGKFVILDFWCRGCGWCIRAMPDLNRFARDSADRPVAVLGMNTDTNVDDARFVIDELKLVYPTLRIDQDLVKSYGVRSFPTMIFIDPAGVVADVHVGFAPDLYDKLEKTADRLLNAQRSRSRTPAQWDAVAPDRRPTPFPVNSVASGRPVWYGNRRIQHDLISTSRGGSVHETFFGPLRPPVDNARHDGLLFARRRPSRRIDLPPEDHQCHRPDRGEGFPLLRRDL